MQNSDLCESNSEKIKGEATVRLAQKDWAVPMLSVRQNKVIDPIILSMLPVFAEWNNDKFAALQKIGADHYDRLLEMTFHAIHKASPTLSRDEYQDFSITLPELIAAFPIIAQQTGIFSRDASGEALAGNVLSGM